jgi:hypothetical protein
MTCKIDGCDRPVIARGMCRRHYQRDYRQQIELGEEGEPSPSSQSEKKVLDRDTKARPRSPNLVGRRWENWLAGRRRVDIYDQLERELKSNC